MTIQDVLKGIYENQDLLREQIKNKDKLANNIANLYENIKVFMDHTSVELLICAYEDWCKENSIKL